MVIPTAINSTTTTTFGPTILRGRLSYHWVDWRPTRILWLPKQAEISGSLGNHLDGKITPLYTFHVEVKMFIPSQQGGTALHTRQTLRFTIDRSSSGATPFYHASAGQIILYSSSDSSEVQYTAEKRLITQLKSFLNAHTIRTNSKSAQCMQHWLSTYHEHEPNHEPD